MRLHQYLLALLAGYISVVLVSASPSDGNSTSTTCVVYPKNASDESQIQQIHKALERILEDTSDPKPNPTSELSSKLISSTSKTVGFNWWRLPLTPKQAIKVAQIPGVYSVYPECDPLCTDATKCDECINFLQEDPIKPEPPPLENTRWAPVWQKTFVSAPRGKEVSYERNYFYRVGAGEGVDVYLIDTGADKLLPEFRYLNLRWLHAGNDYNGETPEDDSGTPVNYDNVGSGSIAGAHGTKMLSLLAGFQLGIARNVNPILVRLPRRNPDLGGGSTINDFATALGKVADDLVDRTEPGLHAVIISPVSFTRRNYLRRLEWEAFANNEPIGVQEAMSAHIAFDAWQARVKGLYQDIVRKGGVNVVSNGNDEVGYPALFVTDEDDPVDSIIPVGAVDAHSENARDYPRPDQFTLPWVSAPGMGILTAQGDQRQLDRGNDWVHFSGTSTAATMTAALVAYFIRQVRIDELDKNYNYAKTPFGMKLYIKDCSLRKGSEYISVIWNNIDWNTQDQVYNCQPSTPDG